MDWTFPLWVGLKTTVYMDKSKVFRWKVRLRVTYIKADSPRFGVGNAVLALLYETYSELNYLDGDAVRTGCVKFYELMNSMSPQEMDRIISLVCQLCRDYEHAGFVEGIKIGILLQTELTEK
jgi:hypothetical protein